jgi:putative ABC transport system permease protein
MTTLSIVTKNLRKRLLGTILTTLSIALGAGLIMAILTIQSETEKSFNQTSVGYDLILAAKGSQLQSTLNTLYHVETSTGIVPYALYEATLNDPRVEYSFPFYVGDSYRQYRVIGTSADYLDKAIPRRGMTYTFRNGRNFRAVHEAVLGGMVADQTGMKVGDTFFFTHGVTMADGGAEEYVHEDHPVTIVGVLDYTGTANDRVIFAAVQTTHSVHAPFQGNTGEDAHSHEHDHEHDDALENAAKPANLDAVLVKFKSPASALQVAGMINYPVPANPVIANNLRRDPLFTYREGLMAVSPAVQINALMSIIGNVDWVLRAIAVLVVIVALFGILVAIYNTMEERKRDIAIMRSLGASRGVILRIILFEAAFICFMGSLLGLMLGWMASAAVAPYLITSAGIFIEPFTFGLNHALVLMILIGLGIIAGTIPALKAYRTDVASHLTPTS